MQCLEWEVGIVMTTTLYVGNLPWATNEEALAAWVSSVAPVKAARIISDRETGRSRGFGFVEVEEEEALRVVEALNGTLLEGRTVTVNVAQARPR